MSFRGLTLFFVLVLICSMAPVAYAQQQDVNLNFGFRESEAEVVQKSLAMAKFPSAFVDTNGDGMFEKVLFDGQEIATSVDVKNALGFSFTDGSKMAYYPTNLTVLPDSGTYGVLAFIHQWDDKTNRLVAVLLHEDKNYETSEGISTFVIDRSGTRVGALMHMFMERGFLRYTAPYQQWLDTGQDFAVGTSPTVSNYLVLGKDLRLMDTVLVMNMSLTSESLPPNQDFQIRGNEQKVLDESRTKLGRWNAITAKLSGGTDQASVNYKGETISGTVRCDQAEGFTYTGSERYVVFYPSTLSELPASLPVETNWKLFGFVHYFDKEGLINFTYGVIIGQKPDEPTTAGSMIKFIDNSGLEVGSPQSMFVPKRAITMLGSQDGEGGSPQTWAIGASTDTDERFYMVKDFGLVEKVFVMLFQWF